MVSLSGKALNLCYLGMEDSDFTHVGKAVKLLACTGKHVLLVPDGHLHQRGHVSFDAVPMPRFSSMSAQAQLSLRHGHWSLTSKVYQLQSKHTPPGARLAAEVSHTSTGCCSQVCHKSRMRKRLLTCYSKDKQLYIRGFLTTGRQDSSHSNSRGQASAYNHTVMHKYA